MDCDPESALTTEDMYSSESEADEEEDEEESMDTDDTEAQEDQKEPTAYLPGQPLKKGEELVVDKTAYKMLHHAQSGAPCLSFDVVLDNLGNDREDYPLSMYLVAGTQAAKAHVNNLLVMKLTNLHELKDDSEDESDDSDGEDDKTPVMSVAPIKHQGCVNRVR